MVRAQRMEWETLAASSHVQLSCVLTHVLAPALAAPASPGLFRDWIVLPGAVVNQALPCVSDPTSICALALVKPALWPPLSKKTVVYFATRLRDYSGGRGKVHRPVRGSPETVMAKLEAAVRRTETLQRKAPLGNVAGLVSTRRALVDRVESTLEYMGHRGRLLPAKVFLHVVEAMRLPMLPSQADVVYRAFDVKKSCVHFSLPSWCVGGGLR